MKTIYKKLIAVLGVCSAFLLGLSVFYMFFASAETEYVGFSVTGHKISANDDARYYIVLNIDGYDESAGNTENAVINIEADGQEKHCYAEIKEHVHGSLGTTKVLALTIWPESNPVSGCDVSGYHFVTLKAGTVVGGKYCLSEDYSFHLSGGVTVGEEETLPLTFNSINAAFNTNATTWRVNLSNITGNGKTAIEANNLPFTAVTAYGKNYVYADGIMKYANTLAEGLQWAIYGEENLTIDLRSSIFGAASCAEAGNHTVTIPRGTLVGAGSLNRVLKHDITVAINGETVSANLTHYAELKYDAQASAYHETNERYNIYVGETSLDVWNGTHTVEIDGTDRTASAFTSHNMGGKVILCLNEAICSKAGYHKIVIEGATLTNSSKYTLVLEGTITLWTENGGIYTQPLYETRTLAVTHNGETLVAAGSELTEEEFVSAYDGRALDGRTQRFIGYLFGTALYAELSDVYAVLTEEDEAVVLEAVTLALYTDEGAGISWQSDGSRIYFSAHIRPAYSVGYGLILTERELLEGREFIRESLSENEYSEICSSDEGFQTTTETGGLVRYSLTLSGLPADRYNTIWAARAYASVSYADGKNKTFYAHYDPELHAGSAYATAQQALTEYEEGCAEYAELRKYIDGVCDIDVNFQLLGIRRYSFSRQINGESISLTLAGIDGYDVSKVRCLCVEGIPVAAVCENGAITFSAADFVYIVFERYLDGGLSGELRISSYGGPSSGVYIREDVLQASRTPATVEDVKDYFDAGFDYLCADDAWADSNRITEAGATQIGDAAVILDVVSDYCRLYGKTAEEAPVLVHIGYLWGIMEGALSEHTLAQKKANLDNYISALKNYRREDEEFINCFAGLTLRDEPRGTQTEDYKYWYHYLSENYPELTLAGTLLGMNAERHATSPDSSDSANYNPTTTEEYIAYVEAFLESGESDGILQVMFDNYPFLETYAKKAFTNSRTTTKSMRTNYFRNLEIIATLAKEYGVKAGVVIQSMLQRNENKYLEIENLGLLKSGSYTYFGGIDSQAYISLQVYSALAYGYTDLAYYVYWQSYSEYAAELIYGAPVMWELQEDGSYAGVKTEMYDYVKNVNNQVKSFRDIFLNFSWKGTKLLSGQVASNSVFGNAADYSGSGAANSASAEYDALIGCFESGDYDGYMIVNVDHPQYDRENTVTVNFGSQYENAVVYIGGQVRIAALNEGVLALSLDEGEGAFVVPIG